MEREKGFEPSTSTLARLHSTTELLPLDHSLIYANNMQTFYGIIRLLLALFKIHGFDATVVLLYLERPA